nr:zinc finger protein weckle [Drosophila kikkawai]
MGIPKNEWLYWCRLCARDDGRIKVRDQDMVSIISKCFDVEMTFEEPELGSMLCEECFSVIKQLVTFSDSVNKVQAIFELLRHSEPDDNVDVEALRQEYGLSSTSSKPDRDQEYQDDFSSDDDERISPDIKIELSWTEPEAEEEQYDDMDEKVVHSPQPVKRKRGRPKGVGNPRRKVAKRKDTATLEQSDLEATAMPSSPTGGPYISNRYACEQCNESFISNVALRTHKHEMHGAPKRFVCDCCGKGLKTSTLLAEHKLVHTDAKPCKCTVCDAAFKNKARLRVHLETHGEPRFKCKICGKMLQTRAILNKHKYVHMDERRFTCEICGSGCKNSTALKLHLLSHTGLRPYVCKYCGKGFTNNLNCRSHKLKKHPDEAYMEDESESSRVPVPTLEELRAITREMAKSSKEEG